MDRVRDNKHGQYTGKLKNTETFASGKSRIMECIIRHTMPYTEIVHEIIRLMERQVSGSICSILVADEPGTHLYNIGALNVPLELRQFLEGLQIGPVACSCGTAAYRREPVIVTDIMTDPLWAGNSSIPAKYHLRACSSLPIFGNDGTVLGTLAMYYHESHAPAEEELANMWEGARLASFAIERKLAYEQHLIAWGDSNERTGHSPGQLLYDMDLSTGLIAYDGDVKGMIGYSTEELAGDITRWIQLIHPDDRAAFENAVEQGNLYQTPFSLAYRVIRKDGTVIDCEDSGHFIKGTDDVTRIAGSVVDITRRKIAEATARSTEEKFRILVENFPGAVYRCKFDPGWTLLYLSDTIKDITGYPASDFIGHPAGKLRTIVHPEDAIEMDHLVWTKLCAHEPYEIVYRMLHRDGSIRWVHGRGRGVYDAQGELLYLDGVIIDCTQSKHAEIAIREREERLRAIVDTTAESIMLIDKTGILVEINPAGVSLLGCENRQILIGRSFYDYVVPDNRPAYQVFNETVCNGHPGMLQFEIRDQHGYLHLLETQSTPLGTEAGNNLLHLAICRDVTERRINEEKIRRLACYDTLTNLPNRVLLHDRLGQAIAQAQRMGHQVAVFFTDIDRFKTINDTLGHPVGDMVLQQVAERLSNVLRGEDTVARVGGDEFVIFMPRVERMQQVVQVAKKCLHTIARTFSVNGLDLHLTTSIGISIYPRDGADTETLLKHADTALYQAKDQGRDHYQFFDLSMNIQAQERLLLENNLRLALERKELVLYYQPQIDVQTQQIMGVEALIRWQCPERGLVPPEQFIPIAEETGLIVPIGEWVLLTACKQAVEWQAQGMPPLRMAVNLSLRQLRQTNLVNKIESILEKTGLVADMLELEITESSIMDNPVRVIEILGTLDNMGIRLALDDFGVGYSSLGYLKRLPLHRIKIDRSFVRDIPGDLNDVAIVRAVLAMAKQLKIGVVAEGVETHEQFQFLKDNECSWAQGYAISKPLPAKLITELLRKSISI